MAARDRSRSPSSVTVIVTKPSGEQITVRTVCFEVVATVVIRVAALTENPFTWVSLLFGTRVLLGTDSIADLVRENGGNLVLQLGMVVNMPNARWIRRSNSYPLNRLVKGMGKFHRRSRSESPRSWNDEEFRPEFERCKGKSKGLTPSQLLDNPDFPFHNSLGNP